MIKSWLEDFIFYSLKITIWIFLHWYALFSIIALIFIYEFWWKKKQEIKESKFVVGDSKNKQSKNKS